MLRTSTLLKLVVLSALAFSQAGASKLNPIRWTLEAGSPAATPGSTVLLQLRAQIEKGYHLYSFTTPPGGPIRTTAELRPNPAVGGFRLYQPTPKRHVDPTFGIPVETFEDSVSFPLLATLRKTADSGNFTPTVQVRYQACSSEICLPPVTRVVSATLMLKSGGALSARPPEGDRLVSSSGSISGAEMGSSRTPLDFRFLGIAFGFGILALFTPCVFPTIPLTVTFLLGGEKTDRRSTLAKAALFCLGIVMIFSLLGLGVTTLAGPFSVIQLASNPWVNGFIAVVFLLMGLSLVGAFNLTLPSSWITSADGAARKSGVIPTLLLGLTFCLASFSCVGPFLGTLLASSAQTGGWTPALGTVAFSFGLASPFFLLASFPAYLKKLPRSGPWLEQTKIIFGFIVLAFAFKYLGSADSVMHWGLFTRERILAIWLALLLVLSLYLLGQVRLSNDEAKYKMSVGRALAGTAVLAVGISLLPGLWGANLGWWEAYLPINEDVTANANMRPIGKTSRWLKDDYQAALAQAKQENKPVLIAFSGYACTNCHWMKANILSKPEVAEALNQYVLLELYTDGTDAASQRNQKLEQDHFATVALPYYVITDASGQQQGHLEGLTRKAKDFVSFLHRT